MLVMLSHCLGNNEECASYKVNGMMRSVHPVNWSVEWIVKVETFVNAQECVSPDYTEPHFLV